MKKTITINIAGLVFNIEEDAYSSLKNYLESIGNKFNNLGERQEIIEDIEARIAELFSEKLNRNKEVISQLDVDNIIGVMGSPDNFEEEESSYSETDTEPKTTSKNEKKKFFRDPDNKVMGGVCAGVSNYFGWDISIVRLIFAFSVLLLGTGFWLYILLWIIIPEAKSTSEKLAMEGKNATVDNISNFVTKIKSNFDHIDTNAIGENIKTQSNKFNQFLVGTSQRFNETIKPKENINNFFNLIFSIVGFIFISAGIALLFSVIYGLIMPENVNQVKMFIHGLNVRLDLQIKDYLPIAISFFVLVASIGIGFIILGIRFAFRKNKELIAKLNPIGITIRFVIILSLISTIILSALNTKLHFKKYSYSHSQDLFYKTIVIKKLEVSNRYSNKEDIKFVIKETSDATPSVEVEKYAFGLESKKINTKKVFDYKIEDSIIYLSPTINYDHGFFQEKEIKVTLYIPDNDSTILINEFDD